MLHNYHDKMERDLKSLETKLKQTKDYLEEVKKENLYFYNKNRKYSRILNEIAELVLDEQVDKNFKGGK